MEIVILDPHDADLMTPLLEEWQAAAPAEMRGIRLEMAAGRETFSRLLASPNADILGAVAGGTLLGFMGLYLRPYHLGPQLMAHECCFFVSARHRGRAGLALIRGAEQWARSHGASHLVLTASRLAADGERAAELYERLGYWPAEIDYLKAVV